ncbi:MAG: hypothetical protein EOO62_02175 [Hymenobacter sp.]|nr:MAG: hypothetical protein EOO62_02175 [Hymenobacter sp.]
MQFYLRSFRLAATVLAFTSLAACSKKDDATPTPTATEGMSWTIDGSNVTATTAVAQSSGTDVTLAGSTGSTGGVFLDMPKTAGTYTLSSTSAASASYVVTPSQGSSQFYDATSGSIVVSTVTATAISGTFTFTGKLSGSTATKTLTNGKFNVKL